MDGVPSLFDDERARQEIAEIIRSRAGHLTRGAEMADGISSWEISALWERVRAARVSSDRVGEIPPEPPTLRGRMGAWLIRSIRRALFWYTPRIAEFQHNASRAIEQEARAIDQIVRENKELRQRVGTLVDNLAEEIRARKALETWTREEVISLRDAWPQALERNRSELQEQTERCLRALEARLHAVIKQEQTRFGSETRAGFRALEDGLLARIAAVTRAAEPIAEQVAAGKSRMDSLEKRLIDDERTMFSTRTRLLSHEMRISVLIDQARKRIPEMSAAELAGFVKEERQKVDDLYLAFENQFRGQREDLKDRMRVYLPILKEHGIGHEGMRLLDVGCGRGEWLELLRENGIEARGVDASRTMVQHCRQFNLPVVEGDAITFLRSFETGSLGGISGFHIIEHLPFHSLLDLIDETVRVLKPGGVAIFETPNPSNLLVASETFYLDPTHRNPLPSMLMRFVAEARGLCRVEVLELNPCAVAVQVEENGSAVAKRFNQLAYGPRDYAIVGWKA